MTETDEKTMRRLPIESGTKCEQCGSLDLVTGTDWDDDQCHVVSIAHHYVWCRQCGHTVFL